MKFALIGESPGLQSKGLNAPVAPPVHEFKGFFESEADATSAAVVLAKMYSHDVYYVVSVRSTTRATPITTTTEPA